MPEVSRTRTDVRAKPSAKRWRKKCGATRASSFGRRRRRSGHAIQSACPGWWRSSARNACSTRRFPKRASPGIAVGAAMTGMRPVVDIMFGDFIDADHGPDGEPGRQGSLHVRRQVESARW